MEISPQSETKPRVRRRLIQSTLFPNKSQDNAVREDEDFVQEEDQENDVEEHCGSQSQSKKNRKRKPKAAPLPRAPRKLAVNGKDIGNKNTDEQDSPIPVKADFFVKVSERRHQKKLQKEYLSIHSPECSPPDVITNSKSPRKYRQRASATPKKQRANATPKKQRANATPKKQKIVTTPTKNALDEACEQMLASPPKPIPDLRLEAKMTAEEYSRIFAGKQIHPFFSSWKAGKKNLERTDTENKWCHSERKDGNDDFCPVHIFEKSQDETLSLDWGNWTFCESCFMNIHQGPECACPPIYEGSVDCLQFDNFLNVSVLGRSLYQNDGSPSQCPIQLEEPSLGERCPAQSSTIVEVLTDKQKAPCNQLRDVELEHEIEKADQSNTGFGLESDIQLQNLFCPERMPLNYHDCDCKPENSLWTIKYQPQRAIEICGNCESVKFLNDWLHIWHEKRSRTNKRSTDDGNCIVQDVDLNYSPSDSDSEDINEETGLKNVLLVTGPVGSGKSAAIYACAKEQGFQVIEVNTSDWRSGALIKQKFGEAMDSHWLQCSSSSMQNPQNLDSRKPLKSSAIVCNVKAAQRSGNEVIELIPLSDGEDCDNVSGTAVNSVSKENTIACAPSEIKALILFEDVDAALHEDRGFLATLQQLAETAKRPMILTSNSEDPDLPNNLDRLEVSFTIPSSEELLSLAHMVCAAEKAKIEPFLVERFIDHCQGDIRKTITLLQFWCQGQNHRKDTEVCNTYAPLLFDINAAHRVVPQMISCGYTSKLAEMVEKEITNSRLMAEKGLGLMEIIEEEIENNDSRMDVSEPDSIEAKKDEMLSRHCSDQDRNQIAAQYISTAELPYCSSSPVPFTRKTLRRKYETVRSSSLEEERLNEGLPEEIVDVNAEVLVNAKAFRRKYDAVLSSDSEEERLNEGLPSEIANINGHMLVGEKTFWRKYDAVMSSDSEEECLNEGFSNKILDVHAEVQTEANKTSPTNCLADEKCLTAASEQLLSEGEKLEKNCHPSIPDYSNINGTCKSEYLSCVPESSFVPETAIENETVLLSTMYSCGGVDGRVKEASTSTDFIPKATPDDFNNLDNCLYEKDKHPVMLFRDFDLNTTPVHGEEVGDSHIDPMEAFPREYQMMDECSRIDFSRKAEAIHSPMSLASTDFVQEAWRKLRNCSMELKQHVSLEEKDTLQVLRLAYGMTNLISEADLLLSDCQSLTCDYLKPSMVPSDKSHSFCWHDDQLKMASTIAQHGFCLYAKRTAAAGSSAKEVDLAWEMLRTSTNAISLGKLINGSKRIVKSLGKCTQQSGASSKSRLALSLRDTVQSAVPLRSQLSLKGYLFHEYVSTLIQISKSESSRLLKGINVSKHTRRRVARNYLSNGALALSPEDISLLDQYSCHYQSSSQYKDVS